jgi:hypothetical protein
MKCQNCHIVNDQEFRFSKNCGSPLKITCPECGAAAAGGEGNCPECGPFLAQDPVSFQSSSQKGIDKQGFHLQSTTKPSTRDSFSKGNTLVGERRIVTILLCDIKGSTSLAEGLYAEEWAEIANQGNDLYKKIPTTIDSTAYSIGNAKPNLCSTAQLSASFLNHPDVKSAAELRVQLT